jgi:hypothetical protein
VTLSSLAARKMHTGFWCGKRRKNDNLENLRIHGRIILKWVVNKRYGRCELDSPGSRCGKMAGSSERVISLQVL